jgi:undecaprenyl-diphosphatase
MTLIQSIILGIIQGATEFLPISSSGHLVLVPNLLGWTLPADAAFALNIILQAATLVAVFSFFLPDILTITQASLRAIQTKSWHEPNARLALFILLSTIPAGFIGFLFNGYFERVFSQPLITAICLLGTAILLVVAENVGKRTQGLEDITWRDALWIGLFQVLALFPGISRSGATITAGMLRDFDRPSSARYSFLISIPLMLAAGVDGFLNFLSLPNTRFFLPQFLVGSITAAIVGYLSIKWLLRFLSQRSLYPFALYCSIFAIINLVLMAIS